MFLWGAVVQWLEHRTPNLENCRTITAAPWLNTSQRSRVGVGMNIWPASVKCKALNRTGLDTAV